MSAVDDLEVKLSHVKGYVRFLHGKRVVVRPYTNSVVADLTPPSPSSFWARGKYSVVPTHADKLRPGDLIEHPSTRTVHRVSQVTTGAADTVIHSTDVDTGRVVQHRTKRKSLIKRIIVGGLALLAAIGIGLAGVHATSSGSTPTTHPQTTVSQVVKQPVHTITPAPTTAQGYAQAFANLPRNEWVAADLGITVPVSPVNGQARSVWLFGDTFSERPGGFVHSTAITQTGGEFHVSNHGQQLLPNFDESHIYWIESATASGEHMDIRARSITITDPGNPWGFADGGISRVASAHVTKDGDVIFEGWTKTIKGPGVDPGPLLACPNSSVSNKDHFCYARHDHPELKLAGGKHLVTTAQNWSDSLDNHRNPDGSMRWSDWNLIFSASK